MSFPITLKSQITDTPASQEVEEEKNQSKESISGWGWLPVLSLIVAISLLAISFSFNLGRSNVDWASWPFWSGLLLMYCPIALRLFSKTAAPRERLGLVVLLGLGLYAVKVLNSPIAFTFHDEFIHWRTANDILKTQHLFSLNPVIPVSPLYPGLQIITTALGNLGGLSIFNSGIIVLATARLALIIAIFLLYSEISHSPRIAGIGCLLYMANPNFLYFSSQFAYESLALPLAALVLFAEARRTNSQSQNRLGLNLLIVFGLIGLVVTHHLTAFAMVGFLGLWIGVAFWRLNSTKFGRTFKGIGQTLSKKKYQAAEAKGELIDFREELTWPGTTFLLIFVASSAWLVYIASFTVGYLAPVLQGAVLEVFHLIQGEEGGRKLFQDSAGQIAPLWEQLSGFAAVGLIVLLLPFGLWAVWKNQRRDILAVTMAVGALAYPATLALRFTVAGWEISNRTSEFVFIPLAYVLAYGMGSSWRRLPTRWLQQALSIPVISVIFLGATLVGTTPYSRLPGPYLVEGDSRSMQAESITAAKWALAKLGPDNRTASDRDNNLLLISYGEQHGVMNVGDKVNVGPLFLSPTIGPLQLDVLKQGKIRYVLVDQRLATGLPMVGIYFESGEPNTNNHKTPIDPADLAKFKKLPGVKKIFDSGNIAIYDVGAISGVS